MIIRLKGANFSASNIGTLSTWSILKTLGTGATSSNTATYVDRGAAYSTTITIADGYEIGSAGVTVTMGGTAITPTISGNTIAISIASVTGNVVIKVPTVNVDKPLIGKTLTFTSGGNPFIELYKEMGSSFNGYTGTVEMGITLKGTSTTPYEVKPTGGCYYYAEQNNLSAGYTAANSTMTTPGVSSDGTQHTYTFTCTNLSAPTDYTLLGIGVSLTGVTAGDSFEIIDYWLAFDGVQQTVDAIGGAFAADKITIS